MSLKQLTIGYPSRPTGGCPLPRDFSISNNEIATPKLDGHRVLVSPHDWIFYNRKKQPYTNISRVQAEVVKGELERIHGVLWWDIEFIPYGVNAGMFMIIDCIIDNEDAYYHERRSKYVSWFPEIDCEVGTVLSSPYSSQGFITPIWVTTKGARVNYGRMRIEATSLALEGKLSIWEGIVVKHASSPYSLTDKQSQNMNMEVKYKFR